MAWEYKVVGCEVGKYYDELLEFRLKPAGEAGWELVHISERPGTNDEVKHLKAYFKRPAAHIESLQPRDSMASSIAAQIEGGGYPRTD